MTKTFSLTGTIVVTGLLAGCAPGLIGGERQTDPHLARVLYSDDDVPAKQGLLFMAMQEAEVARQSAGHALAADEPEEAKDRISNVLYSIDPAYPPTPTVTAYGIAAFWPATGFGLRRAVQEIAEQMRAVSGSHEAGESVVTEANQVEQCAEQTLMRVERIESLGQQALAADSPAELAPLLIEIDRLTQIVLEAPAAEAVDACSLEDAKIYLESLALELA